MQRSLAKPGEAQPLVKKNAYLGGDLVRSSKGGSAPALPSLLAGDAAADVLVFLDPDSISAIKLEFTGMAGDCLEVVGVDDDNSDVDTT